MANDPTAILTSSPANTCVAIGQQAGGIVSDMHSAYWSVVEGKQAPAVFINQTEDRIKTIQNLLTILKGMKVKHG